MYSIWGIRISGNQSNWKYADLKLIPMEFAQKDLALSRPRLVGDWDVYQTTQKADPREPTGQF